MLIAGIACAPGPCSNGGTCITDVDGNGDATGMYTCNCLLGYEGGDCQIGESGESNLDGTVR